jgi:hypothetical protein
MMAVGGCGRESSSFVVAYPRGAKAAWRAAIRWKARLPAGVQIALTALGDKRLIVAFAQQRNALMAFSISQRVA